MEDLECGLNTLCGRDGKLFTPKFDVSSTITRTILANLTQGAILRAQNMSVTHWKGNKFAISRDVD